MEVFLLQQEFKTTNKKLKGAIARAVLKSCVDVETDWKKSINDSHRERESIPGEPPRKVTGRLQASVTHRMDEENGVAVGEIGTNVEYALDLELGTSKTFPHPMAAPAYDKNEVAILERIGKAVEKEFSQEEFGK